MSHTSRDNRNLLEATKRIRSKKKTDLLTQNCPVISFFFPTFKQKSAKPQRSACLQSILRRRQADYSITLTTQPVTLCPSVILIPTSISHSQMHLHNPASSHATGHLWLVPNIGWQHPSLHHGILRIQPESSDVYSQCSVKCNLVGRNTQTSNNLLLFGSWWH